MDPLTILTTALKGVEAGTLLVKVVCALIDALSKASGMTREQCLEAVRIELAATKKAQDEAEARERQAIEGK